MKNFIYTILFCLILIGCSTRNIQNNIPKNQLLSINKNDLIYDEINNEVNEINNIIERLKIQNEHKIIITGGIYEQTYWPESEWCFELQEIVSKLEEKGYNCYPFYKNIYGEGKDCKVNIGLEILF